jgi:AraC-like DNA-binding protein
MEFKHELVMPNRDLPFRMFIFEGKDGNYSVEKHWHHSVEIFAVFEGNIDFYINSEKNTLHAGDFMIVNSNEIHSIKAPVKNKTIVLQIPFSSFANYYTDDMFIQFSHNQRLQDKQMIQLIEEMFQTYEEKQLGYGLKVQSLFYMLVYLMVTEYRVTKVSADIVRKNKRLSRLSAITTYIRDNYTEDLTLENIAEKFGYSPTYLSKMFHKYANINYKDYLQNIRLENAFKELTNTESTISDVAINNGFPSNKAFTKAFKKKYDMLPSIYRKNT